MKPYHKNPRRINKKQFEQLRENLLYLGDLSGIVHDLNSNEIVGGNQRSSVFDVNECDVEIVHQYDYPDEQGTIAHGFIIWKNKRYTYRQVRWTPKQCEQANITANRLGGEWDFDELANWDMSDLLTWGFEESDFPFDVAPAMNEGADAEPQIDKAEELRQKWDVQSGQMWQLGEHRIICGDCTDRAVVERVMGREKANMLLTDPPYGVSYADKNKWLNAVAFGNRIQTPIENDHEDIADTAKNLWLPSFSRAFECCCDTSSFYLFMPQGGDQMMMMMMMMNDAGWMPRHELIWVKNNHVLGRADYNYKHEPILYGWKRKGTHKFYGDFQTSVIECNKPHNSDLHPTMKPVELIERLVPNNTQVGEIVYEPFSGSGTTLIACENLSRKCRAVEISPAYVAVAIQRWVDVTGKEPILL
jgi:DNA modification methylase